MHRGYHAICESSSIIIIFITMIIILFLELIGFFTVNLNIDFEYAVKIQSPPSSSSSPFFHFLSFPLQSFALAVSVL